MGRSAFVIFVVAVLSGCPSPSTTDAGDAGDASVFLEGDAGQWRAGRWGVPGQAFDVQPAGVVVAFSDDVAHPACLPTSVVVRVVTLTPELAELNRTELSDAGNAQSVSWGGSSIAVAANRQGAAIIALYDTQLASKWVRELDGTENDQVREVRVQNTGEVVFAGVTRSALAQAAGGQDVFVGTYTSAGAVGWLQQFGTSADDELRGLAVWDGHFALLVETTGTLGASPSSTGLYLVEYSLAGALTRTTPLAVPAPAQLELAGSALVALSTSGSTVSLQRWSAGSAAPSSVSQIQLSCPGATLPVKVRSVREDEFIALCATSSERDPVTVVRFSNSGAEQEQRTLPLDSTAPIQPRNIVPFDVLNSSGQGAFVLSGSTSNDACAGMAKKIGVTRF